MVMTVAVAEVVCGRNGNDRSGSDRSGSGRVVEL